MILADTSAWVEYDRATGSAVHRRMRQLIAEEEPLATTQAVVMEVVAGARDAQRERDLRRLLSRFALLPFEAAADFDGAAGVPRVSDSRRDTARAGRLHDPHRGGSFRGGSVGARHRLQPYRRGRGYRA